MNRTVVATACLLAPFLILTPARADCRIPDAGHVGIIMNFFPVLELLSDQMKACATDKLKIDSKLTTEHTEQMTQAFEAARSPYDAAAVANESIAQIEAKGLLLPLNKFVDKYRDEYKIEDQMLIRFGGDIMAVAFQINAQHLFFRTDLLEKYHLPVPKTYAEVLSDLAVLKQEPSIEAPFAAAYKSGWELGNEFVDVLLAEGGSLIDPASNEPTFNNEKGVAALELMKQLKAYMSPNALGIDFGGVRQQLQQGRVAMAFLWGDQASTMDDPKESKVIGKIGFAGAPTITPGGAPATCFWWDGFVIPKNLTDDPDLTFRVFMEALRPEVVTQHNDMTLWIRSNYKPSKYAQGVIESIHANAPAYPMVPAATMAHAALGDHVGDALAGKQSSQQALDDAAQAYRQAARDAGLVK